MWTCPACGLVFDTKEHACQPDSPVDQYIKQQREEVRPLLTAIRQTIRQAAPEAQERISYQMPTFWLGENLIHFGAFQRHIGLYPGGEATGVFAARLAGYRTSKGAIQLPLDHPLDHQLITDLTRFRLAQARERQAAKAARGKKQGGAGKP